LGRRDQYLQMALQAIANLPFTHVVKVSDLYETEPVGFVNQPAFLNLAALVVSDQPIYLFLQALQSIELSLGREREVRFGPRTLDIDILLCDQEVISQEPELIIPHPRMQERAFVLIPLSQIVPGMIHPLLGETISELCTLVDGKEGVRWHSTSLPSDCGLTES